MINYYKNNITCLYKLDTFYYFLFAFLLLLYGHNNIMDIILIILIAVLLLVNIKKDNFLLSYFALIFFEPILILPFLGGSFFRIYHIMFFLRLFIDAVNHIKYKFSSKINILAAMLFLLLSLIYTQSINGVISSVTNILILIYFFIYDGKMEKQETYSKILAVVGIFSAVSGIYGMFFGKEINYGYTIRMSATIGDPNYSALFYTLGLFSAFGTNSINKKLKVVLSIILCILLISTVSISGILGTIMLFITFVGIKKMSKGILVGATTFLTFIVFMQISFNSGTSFYGLQYRILTILKSNDLGVITSYRFNIGKSYIEYFRHLPTVKQFFGGNNTVSGNTRDMMVNLIGQVSHNSYIDMLYMVGIIGTVLILFLFLVMIINLIKKYKQSNNAIFLSVAFLKITILYYSLSISIFPFRYFNTFFIL